MVVAAQGGEASSGDSPPPDPIVLPCAVREVPASDACLENQPGEIANGREAGVALSVVDVNGGEVGLGVEGELSWARQTLSH